MSMEPVLRWAASQMGAGARPVAVKGLRAGAGPWRLRIDRGGTVLEAVLRVGDTSSRQLLATEAAALAFAEAHQLAAPRLLAVDLDGAVAGRPVLLMTALAGTSTIPPGRVGGAAAGVGGRRGHAPQRGHRARARSAGADTTPG
jgi:aminoglycoside phosphotransferase